MARLSQGGEPFDLFDVLAAEEAPDVVHMVLPNFATACGLDFLEVSRFGQIKGTRLYTLTSTDTTCPTCLATGARHGGLPALCRRISSHPPRAELRPHAGGADTGLTAGGCTSWGSGLGRLCRRPHH